jgi:hypothetical protein
MGEIHREFRRSIVSRRSDADKKKAMQVAAVADAKLPTGCDVIIGADWWQRVDGSEAGVFTAASRAKSHREESNGVT